MATQFPRLRHVFGVEVEHATAESIQKLVDDEVVEASDLEFKSALYRRPNNDSKESSKKDSDFAEDVAAMANAGGGVIVIGVAEDSETGRAKETCRVSIAEEEESWFRNKICSCIFPLPSVQIKSVRLADDKASGESGFWLIIVSDAGLAPHAVLKNGKYLTYPTRPGRGNYFLSESEVATRYRNRFESDRKREARLHRLIEDGRDRWRSWSSGPWIELALVPAVAGSLTIRRDVLTKLEGELYPKSEADRLWGPNDAPTSRIGFRHLHVSRLNQANQSPALMTPTLLLELHHDGAIYWACRLRFKPTDQGPFVIFEESLAMAFGQLLFKAPPFVRSNGNLRGEALLKATVIKPPQGKMTLSLKGTFSTSNQHAGAELEQDAVLERMVNLDDIDESGARGRFLYELLNDFVQAFGQDRTTCIDENGALNWLNQEGFVPTKEANLLLGFGDSPTA
jgi:hypothetical protein